MGKSLPLSSNHGPSARTELPEGSLENGDVRSVSEQIHRDRLKPRKRHIEFTDAEWRSLRSWAASYDASPGQMVVQVMRTWQRHKYPIEWVARPVGEKE